MSGRTLFVFVGAGASYGSELKAYPNHNDAAFRAPLTAHLFNPGQELESIRARYDQINGPVMDFLSRSRNAEKVTIEQFLREFRDSKDDLRVRQYKTIAIYLQHLFQEVSRNYLTVDAAGRPTPGARARDGYSLLVDRIYAATEAGVYKKVCFVSFNYDSLLDRAIQSHFNLPEFSRIDEYVTFRNDWHLIKLHGSHNWWYKSNSPSGEYFSTPRQFLLETIRQEPRWRTSSYEVEVNVDVDRVKDVGQHRHLYFPAIAVPVDDKNEPVCPANHVNYLRALAQDETCGKDILVIGHRGVDRDLFEACDMRNAGRFMAVCESQEACEEVRVNFTRGWVNLRQFPPHYMACPWGFAQFVEKPAGLRAFLAEGSQARI